MGGASSVGVDTDGNEKGQIISVANGAASYGVGVMGDAGGIIDSYGNTSMYLTIGVITGGYGASGGMGYSLTSKYTKTGDMGGNSVGVLLQFPGKYLKNASIEGYEDLSQGAVIEHYGAKYSGVGLNLGVGAFYGIYVSHTFLFPGFTSDYWSRPGSRR